MKFTVSTRKSADNKSHAKSCTLTAQNRIKIYSTKKIDRVAPSRREEMWVENDESS